jgi:hypothetical protein
MIPVMLALDLDEYTPSSDQFNDMTRTNNIIHEKRAREKQGKDIINY